MCARAQKIQRYAARIFSGVSRMSDWIKVTHWMPLPEPPEMK
ncbi:MAG: hypothetical protein DRR06_18530 [Gammaproteobacteria bacterium]|nr:MAG: hypothetical protein DRR06_18530 [Gammaproteobacteria bacterium]